MSSLLKIRDIEVSKHKSDEYALVFFYFLEKDANNKMLYTYINQELYLVDGLKVNILMENDVIGSEKISINITKKTTLITSCGVQIKIDTK